MLSFSKFLRLEEAFDTVSDFMLNPDHRNKTWQEIEAEFKASGGKFLGSGQFGLVYEHPSWPYVLKIFTSDSPYIKFVRFAYRNPHPAFPKFYGQPQRIIPSYRRFPEQSMLYLVRMEKLYPVEDHEMLTEIQMYNEAIISYFDALEKGHADQEYEKIIHPSLSDRQKGMGMQKVKVKHFQNVLDLFQNYPQARILGEAIYIVWKNIKDVALDIKDGNILQRPNGSLVLADPVWEGSNPYADAKRRLDMELDAYGDMPYEEPTLMGGQLPKRKRKKKFKPSKVSQLSIPF